MQKEELLTRGVAKLIPKELAEQKIASGKKLRVYLGIDPTGAKLHLGHAIPLRKLRAFANAGHHAIFLIGSFTATVGDPTGQDAMREQLSREQVAHNMKSYKAQASKIIDVSKVEIRYNDEWYSKMNGLDFMNIASHFTVQQMMQRDMFKERMKWKVICVFCKGLSDSPLQFQSVEDKDKANVENIKVICSHCNKKTPFSKETIFPPPNPVSSHELLYPALQGYDSVMLDVDFEIGGSDQLFNILCGRKLQKIYKKREKCVLTLKLIEGIDGRKMSKTYNNCIYLEDLPSEMFGKVMSLKDDLMETYFECCTDVPVHEYKELLKGNARDAKARLAHEIVTLYHGKSAADKAQKEFENVFRKGELPADMPEVKVKKRSLLIDVLVDHKLVSSKSDARRLIEQKGIHLNDHVIDSVAARAEKGVVRIGKRKFLKLI